QQDVHNDEHKVHGSTVDGAWIIGRGKGEPKYGSYQSNDDEQYFNYFIHDSR
ncbi:MAG: hypothetical protein JJ882_15350, partial [Balneola sp.]|nr:hypothetical protein [Balneola sp.]